MLLIHELHLNTPCAQFYSLLTMLFVDVTAVLVMLAVNVPETFAEFYLALLNFKMLHLACPFRSRRLDKVMRFYVKEFFNPWHRITLTDC